MTASNVAESGTRRPRFFPTASVVLLIVAAVYWPVTHAGIVWDDKIWFYKEAWLRDGNAWMHFMFHGFFEWQNYFRPLVVGLFTFETRFFQDVPERMHVVSLGIHLANTLLVGLLALRVRAPPKTQVARPTAIVAMTLFGLHPALIEPVAWVSCQFDLVVLLFMLLGLFLHLTIVRPSLRAMLVAACFFFAACSKEFAVSMPILLVLADVTMQTKQGKCATIVDTLLACWHRQKATYVAVFITGLAYLALRYWGLGSLAVPGSMESLSILERFQTVCFVYAHYLRIIVWPMYGFSPVHVVDTKQFSTISLALVATDAIAVLIFVGAVWLALRRNLLGILVLAATVALFPALHIIPVAFDPSIYHARYAMPAIAMTCIWLPGLLRDPSARFAPKGAAIAVPTVIACWFLAAILNIAVTLPLWSDDILLWQWVMKEQPTLVAAQDELLSTYIDRSDPRARALADRLVAEHPECSNCMLNAAYLAISNNDIPRTEAALKHLQQSPDMASSESLYSGYILAVGQLLEMQNNFVESEQAYRRAIETAPYDPQPLMELALLLARERRTGEARLTANRAIALFPPGERARRQGYFEHVLAQPMTAPSRP